MKRIKLSFYFLFGKKNKTVIEKILLKRDYRRLEYIQMVLLLQQLTRFRLIDFDSSVGRNVSGE